MHSYFSVAISWGNKMNFSLIAKCEHVGFLLRQSQLIIMHAPPARLCFADHAWGREISDILMMA